MSKIKVYVLMQGWEIREITQNREEQIAAWKLLWDVVTLWFLYHSDNKRGEARPATAGCVGSYGRL